jgi:hypothetical protein
MKVNEKHNAQSRMLKYKHPFFMEIYLNKNNQLNCDSDDLLFSKTVAGLLELTDSFKNNIVSVESINTDMVTSFGDICNSLLLTKYNNNKNDLYSESAYPNIFIGKHSEKFIEVMMLLQELCQLSWHLDTYPTLELWDKGVRQKDKEYFYKMLNLLHNKLLILDDKIQKNRE